MSLRDFETLKKRLRSEIGRIEYQLHLQDFNEQRVYKKGEEIIKLLTESIEDIYSEKLKEAESLMTLMLADLDLVKDQIRTETSQIKEMMSKKNNEYSELVNLCNSVIKSKDLEQFACMFKKLDQLDLDENLKELRVQVPELSQETGFKIICPSYFFSFSNENRGNSADSELTPSFTVSAKDQTYTTNQGPGGNHSPTSKARPVGHFSPTEERNESNQFLAWKNIKSYQLETTSVSNQTIDRPETNLQHIKTNLAVDGTEVNLSYHNTRFRANQFPRVNQPEENLSFYETIHGINRSHIIDRQGSNQTSSGANQSLLVARAARRGGTYNGTRAGVNQLRLEDGPGLSDHSPAGDGPGINLPNNKTESGPTVGHKSEARPSSSEPRHGANKSPTRVNPGANHSIGKTMSESNLFYNNIVTEAKELLAIPEYRPNPATTYNSHVEEKRLNSQSSIDQSYLESEVEQSRDSLPPGYKYSVEVIGGRVGHFYVKVNKSKFSCELEGVSDSKEINADFKKILEVNPCIRIQVIQVDKKAKHQVNLFLCSKQNQDDCQDIRELFKFLGYSVEMFMSSSAGVSMSELGSLSHLFPLGTETQVFYASDPVGQDVPVTPDNILVFSDDPSVQHLLQQLNCIQDEYLKYGVRPAGPVEPDDVIVVQAEGTFYRGRVLSFNSQERRVRVSYVDVRGGTEVSWWDSYTLLKQFHITPFLVMTRMFNVGPKGDVWNKEVSDALHSLLQSKSLTMKIEKVLKDGLLVNFYSREDSLRFNIGKRLFNMGLIERLDISAETSEDIDVVIEEVTDITSRECIRPKTPVIKDQRVYKESSATKRNAWKPFGNQSKHTSASARVNERQKVSQANPYILISNQDTSHNTSGIQYNTSKDKSTVEETSSPGSQPKQLVSCQTKLTSQILTPENSKVQLSLKETCLKIDPHCTTARDVLSKHCSSKISNQSIKPLVNSNFNPISFKSDINDNDTSDATITESTDDEDEVESRHPADLDTLFYPENKVTDMNNKEIQILYVESPLCIQMRRCMDEAYVDNMLGMINNSLERVLPVPVSPHSIQVNSLYLARIDGVYQRVVVTKIMDKATVFCSDLGIYQSVEFNQLFMKTEKMLRQACQTFVFKIRGVLPIDNRTWTEARLKLTNLGKAYKVFLRNVEKGEDGFVGDLEFFKEKNQEDNNSILDPVEPGILASDYLIRYSLARKCKQIKQFESIKPLPPSLPVAPLSLLNSGIPYPDVSTQKGTKFSGIISGIDDNLVFWILPESQYENRDLIYSITSPCELSNSVQISKGDILLDCTEVESPVRVMIVKKLNHDIYQVIEIDAGGAIHVRNRTTLRQVPKKFESIPPTTVPVQLYGLKKQIDCLSGKQLLDILRIDHPSLFCDIHVKVPTPLYPKQAVVLMEGGVNLAIRLLETRGFMLCSGLEDWMREVKSSGLDWIEGNSPELSSPLPSFLPVQVGMTFIMTLTSFLENISNEPVDSHTRGLIVHPIPGSKALIYLISQEGSKESWGLSVELEKSNPYVSKLHNVFNERKEEYKMVSNREATSENWKVGNKVLAFFEDDENPNMNEWTRGVINAVDIREKTASVYFSDYRYIGTDIPFRNLRPAAWNNLMEPVQFLQTRYDIPVDQHDAEMVLKELQDTSSYKLAKVERIDYEKEEVFIKIFSVKVKETGSEVEIYKL